MQITINKLWDGTPIVSEADAKKLCNQYGERLPKIGNEKLVEYQGKNYWLKRTIDGGKTVWWIQETSWRREGAMLVL